MICLIQTLILMLTCLCIAEHASALTEHMTVMAPKPGIDDKGGSINGAHVAFGHGHANHHNGEHIAGGVGVPKPWPKTMCKATISCWSETSIGHTCEVAGNYLTADEAHFKLEQINCCVDTAGGGRPNGYAEWKGCGIF